MENLSRRRILSLAATGWAASAVHPAGMRARSSDRSKKSIPVLHATDLFRPHMDPDDHWDLACVYALARRGDIDLKGILIDYPPANAQDRNPDIAAVAQMNAICGLSVPIAVGTAVPLKSLDDTQARDSEFDHHGAQMVLDILTESPGPVVINILGSSRDVALAGRKNPGLFKAKCAAIYLNAGTGSQSPDPASKLEYNVTLDRCAYAAIFDLPCPVYWMPCFESMESRRAVGEFGTHYRFRQDRILPHLSETVRNYFAYMFARYTDHNWLGYLRGKNDSALLSKYGAMDRHMWCTAGFLHAAGYTVSHVGRIVRPEERAGSPVFTFDPIRVKCDESGVTEWTPDESSKNRYIFHVRDKANYQPAMTEAMKSLLITLP